MGHMRKFAWVLIVVLAMNLCLAVSAAEDSTGVWMNMETTSDTVVVSICTDTEVSSGVIRLSYDSSKMTYAALEIDTDLFAVNAEETGVVLISWIASGETATEEDGRVLMQVKFTGTLPEDLTLSGEVYTPTGETIRVTNLDFVALESAIAEAEGLKEADYTADSFAALQTALAEAKAVLEDVTATQKDVDAAEQKLREAVANLELAPVEGPDDNDQVDNTNKIGLWIGIGIAAAVLVVGAAVVVVIVMIKKKGAAK